MASLRDLTTLTAADDYPELVVEVLFTQGRRAADGDWTDISRYVRRGETWQGRQRALDRFEAGTLKLTLSNANRLFDPDYADGPYYPWLRPRRRIRAGIIWDDDFQLLWSGYVKRWGQTYFDDKDAVCDVDAVDGFVILAQEKIPDGAPWDIEVKNDRPLVWWKLSESPSANTETMFDSSGNGHNGYHFFAPTSGAGAIAQDSNTALTYDGTAEFSFCNDPVVLAAMGTSSTCSIEFWFKTTATAAVDEEPFFGVVPVVGGDPGGPTSLFLSAGNKIGNPSLSSDAAVNDGSWHHVALVVVGGSATSLYLDGVLQSGGGLATTGSGTVPGVFIGGYFGTSGTYMLNTSMDEVAIYDKVLSATRVLAHYNAGASAWEGDLSGARVERVLDFIGWPDTLRDIDAGNSTLQGQPLPGGTALEYLQKAYETERGHFFMERAGTVYWGQRHGLLTDTRSANSQATFGDAASGAPLRYIDIELDNDDTLIYPTAKITREGGVTQEVSDTDAADEYGGVYERSGLMFANDNDALDMANFLVARYADPKTRVEGFTIKPRRATAPSVWAQWEQVRDRRIGDRVTVSRTPQGVGSPIAADVIIEGIRHQFAPRFWQTRYAASQAETTRFWIWDDATYSVWDSTTRWAA